MSDPHQSSRPSSSVHRDLGISNVIQLFQLVALVIGFAALAFQAGQRDVTRKTNQGEITELKTIVRDLITLSVTVVRNEQDINRLEQRLRELESRLSK